MALPELVPVVVTDASQEKSKPVAGGESRASRPIGAPSHEGALEIVLPGDVRVTVRGRVEERTLRAVLSVLRSA